MAYNALIQTDAYNAASDLWTAITVTADTDKWDIEDADNKVCSCPASANENGIKVWLRVMGCENQQYLTFEMGESWSGGAWVKECREIAFGATRPMIFTNPGVVNDTEEDPTAINVWLRVQRGATAPAYVRMVAEGDPAYSGICAAGYYGSFTRLHTSDTTAMMGASINGLLGTKAYPHVYQTHLGSYYWDNGSNDFYLVRHTPTPQGNPSSWDGDWWLWPIGIADNQTNGELRGQLTDMHMMGAGGWSHKDTLTDTGTSNTYGLFVVGVSPNQALVAVRTN